jgi:TRAP-type mannitol/chloroaromatic compound transport system permease small subunit
MKQSKISSSFEQYINAINDTLFRLVSWFTLVMVVLTMLIVVLRYGFDLGWIAMQESVLYFHSLVFLLGAAHTLKVNEHVRVDIFYRQFDPVKQSKVDLFGGVFLGLPVNLFIFTVSFNYVVESWRLFEGSGQSGGLPIVFILKSFILLFAATMTLQHCAQIIRNVVQLQKRQMMSQGS